MWIHSVAITWLCIFFVDANQPDRNLIVSGESVVEGRYSYATSLQYGRNHICGASLIAPDLVLTAAHCFDKPDLIHSLRVVIGEYHLQDLNDSGETLYIESINVHPQYLVTNTYVDNDVMILKLSGFSRHQPVKLNAKNSIPLNEAQLVVMGWGSLDVNGMYMSNILQEVKLSYIPRWKCLTLGIPIVTDNMMCTFDQDFDFLSEDSCYGDSGGPLILMDDQASDLQVGIVSYGSEVCAERPGINVRISSVFDWIRERTCVISDDPPAYFECESFDISDYTNAPSMKPTAINQLTSPTNVPTFVNSHLEDVGGAPKEDNTLGPTSNDFYFDELHKKSVDGQMNDNNQETNENGTFDNTYDAISNKATSLLTYFKQLAVVSVLVLIINTFYY